MLGSISGRRKIEDFRVSYFDHQRRWFVRDGMNSGLAIEQSFVSPPKNSTSGVRIRLLVT